MCTFGAVAAPGAGAVAATGAGASLCAVEAPGAGASLSAGATRLCALDFLFLSALVASFVLLIASKLWSF